MDRVERAARRYCELMGTDPDAVCVWYKDQRQTEAQLATHKIREALALQQALKETEP